MENVVRKFFMMLVVLISLTLTSCRENGDNVTREYIDYSTGISYDGQYDNKLFGLNEANDILGCDPGAFYVSLEEDEVYGGYYYMYPTSSAVYYGASLKDEYYTSQNIEDLVGLCYRSKDLFSWERCGFYDGYVCAIEKDDWCTDLFWAPEVIRNPKNGKYYLYFTANYSAEYGAKVESLSDSGNAYDRLCIGVAESNTPVGPFKMIYDVDAKTGLRIPTINFHQGCKTKYPWAAIDVSPFFDDNGDFYLYFNKHEDDHYNALKGVWGVKMNSMSSPDYQTVSCLTVHGRKTVKSEPGKIETVQYGEEYIVAEDGINEGPFMLKHNGKYYLTYSIHGYGHISYSVYQAISTHPLDGFVKLDIEDGNPVIDGSNFSYMNGTGHHAFVRRGEEIWAVYHRHTSADGYQGFSSGRQICADRIKFVKNDEGEEVLTCNGPSKCLVWLPESISGMKNYAKMATISVTDGTGVEYLNDELLPYYTFTNRRLFETSSDTTITLTWNSPIPVLSLMVYNAKNLNNAFSKIRNIEILNLNKQVGDKKHYAVIEGGILPQLYYNLESQTYIDFAPFTAEFDEILTTEIKITIDSDDKLVEYNDLGECNTVINIGEIVVLGGEQR